MQVRYKRLNINFSPSEYYSFTLSRIITFYWLSTVLCAPMEMPMRCIYCLTLLHLNSLLYVPRLARNFARSWGPHWRGFTTFRT